MIPDWPYFLFWSTFLGIALMAYAAHMAVQILQLMAIQDLCRAVERSHDREPKDVLGSSLVR